MDRRDYYEEARQLSKGLSNEGFEGWGQKLDDAIAAGSTATEILMALRWHSRQIKEAGLPLSDSLTKRLNILLKGLDEALR